MNHRDVVDLLLALFFVDVLVLCLLAQAALASVCRAECTCAYRRAAEARRVGS